MSFDSMIQHMGRAGRKGQQAAFILFMPKWTQIKDSAEIEKRLAKRSNIANGNSHLSDLNRPKGTKQSPLGQEVDIEDLSDGESVASSEYRKAEDEFNDPATNQLFDILSTEAEVESQTKKKKKQVSKGDVEKRANLLDEIFDYIHTAKCRRLFSLAWYDDKTYKVNADSSSKALPRLYCNASDCNSEDPECLKRAFFVNTSAVRYIEAD